MPSLVETIKKLKEIKNSKKDIVIQNVVFDLSNQFIGKPMTPTVLKNLSSYIDHKLVEFSRVHGTFPAIMRPSRDLVDSEDGSSFSRLPEKLSDISQTAINALKEAIDEQEIEDEHICHSQDSDGFTRSYPSIIKCVDGDPMTRQGGSKYVRTHLISDEKSEEECASEETYDNIMETQLSNVNQNIPNEFGSSEIIDMDQDTLISSRGYYDSTTGESVKTIHEIQRRLIGKNQIEELVYSHGCLDTMTDRTKDVIIRVPQNDSDESEQNDSLTGIRMTYHTNRDTKIKDISYITSYELDRTTQTIKTRIITAPNTVVISNEEWFDMIYGRYGSEYQKDLNISDIIKTNLCIISKTRAESIKFEDANLSEQTALETLREMITEKEFRHYLRYGFLIVKSNSGRLYQIYRNKSHTKVWLMGNLLEEICVRIKNNEIPHTDNIIAFKTMIETNEEDFRKLGNIYKTNIAA